MGQNNCCAESAEGEYVAKGKRRSFKTSSIPEQY